ncbi:MAG: hypothetical protein AAFN07_07670 [Pseudomonadota bacterium]
MTTKEEKARRMEVRRGNGSRALPNRASQPQGPPYAAHYACLACRKSFKRTLDFSDYPDGWPTTMTCPQCGGPSLNFGRKFKPPRQSDRKQWEKVKALAEHGFWFHSSAGTVEYPKTLQEVPEFLDAYAHLVRGVDPDLWECVIAYCKKAEQH